MYTILNAQNDKIEEYQNKLLLLQERKLFNDHQLSNWDDMVMCNVYDKQIKELEYKVHMVELYMKDFGTKITENKKDNKIKLMYGEPKHFGIEWKLKNEVSTLFYFSGDSLYLWKIDSINEKVMKNITVNSTVFYNQDLYKMRLSLNPDGNNPANREYLSLFFQIGIGKYDNDLIWPYKSTVRFEMINFSNERANKFYKVPAQTQISSYKRPTSEFNQGFGVLRFQDNAKLIPQFIRNDAILIMFYPKV